VSVIAQVLLRSWGRTGASLPFPVPDSSLVTRPRRYLYFGCGGSSGCGNPAAVCARSPAAQSVDLVRSVQKLATQEIERRLASPCRTSSSSPRMEPWNRWHRCTRNEK
jgi:hypothetical protein